jgi:hypothetical protein
MCNVRLQFAAIDALSQRRRTLVRCARPHSINVPSTPPPTPATCAFMRFHAPQFMRLGGPNTNMAQCDTRKQREPE